MKELKTWQKATNALAQKFVDVYFNEGCEPDERLIILKDDWVSYDVGGVLEVGDYSFGMDMIREALEFSATSKMLFDYYDEGVELGMKGEEQEVNFENYVKYYKGFGK